MAGQANDIQNGQERKRGLLTDQNENAGMSSYSRPVAHIHNLEFSVRNKYKQ